MPALRRFNRQRHLVRNLEAVTFERHHFARMIRKHANPPQPEIDQNLRADSALMLHESLPPRILFASFAPVITNLRQGRIFGRARINSKSAASVMQINKHAAIGRGNRRERPLDDLVAIARG